MWHQWMYSQFFQAQFTWFNESPRIDRNKANIGELLLTDAQCVKYDTFPKSSFLGKPSYVNKDILVLKRKENIIKQKWYSPQTLVKKAQTKFQLFKKELRLLPSNRPWCLQFLFYRISGQYANSVLSSWRLKYQKYLISKPIIYSMFAFILPISLSASLIRLSRISNASVYVFVC